MQGDWALVERSRMPNVQEGEALTRPNLIHAQYNSFSKSWSILFDF